MNIQELAVNIQELAMKFYRKDMVGLLKEF